jgi:hypothetical protein
MIPTQIGLLVESGKVKKRLKIKQTPRGNKLNHVLQDDDNDDDENNNNTI